jgi:hypothetical protein
MMFGTIISAITGLFAPATQLIDKVTTTDEERLQLRNELAKIEAGVTDKMLEVAKLQLEAEIKVKTAELNSGNWLVQSWRPATSIVLVGLVIYHSYSGKPMPPEMSSLVELFLGVYSGGRTLEKIASSVKIGKQ